MMDLFDESMTTKAHVEEVLQRYESAAKGRYQNSNSSDILRNELVPLVAAGHTEIVLRVNNFSALHDALSDSLRPMATLDEAIECMSIWALGCLTESARVTAYARVGNNSIGLSANDYVPMTAVIAAIARRAVNTYNVGLACVVQCLIATALAKDVRDVVARVGGSAVMRELDEIIDTHVMSLRAGWDLS